MTERGTKTFIGAFVLGALALLVGLVILLGSGTFSSRNPTFVLYFNTSLKGLTPGSPVYFKGIRIGRVSSIQIRPEVGTARFQTPVVIEIEKEKATALLENGSEKELFDDPDILNRLIRAGLRGFFIFFRCFSFFSVFSFFSFLRFEVVALACRCVNFFFARRRSRRFISVAENRQADAGCC